MGLPAVAAAAERVVADLVHDRLRARGWQEAPLGYRGYAAGGRARVLGRVLMSRPGRDDVAEVHRAPRRGWRHFVTPEVPGVPVEVRLGSASTTAVSDPGGYLDVELEVDLPPGWHDAELTAPATGRTARAPVHVVDPAARLGLVSDVDDTVMHSAVTQPARALWNAVVLREDARLAVPGVSAVYERLLRQHPGTPVFYLSTGAWSTEGVLRRFLERHGFPPGPLLLTDWGPSADRWFRDGRAHKRAALARLVAEMPEVRWVLVGDSGQADRDVYVDLVHRHPDRVAAVVIREVGPQERRVRERRDGVLVASAKDADEVAAALVEAGVLAP